MFWLLDEGFFQKKTPSSMFFTGRRTIIKAVIPLIIKKWADHLWTCPII